MSEENDFKPTPMPLIVAAIAVAAAPAFFFANPLHIHMSGEMHEYWGIAVFSSAILAGLAFFRDGDFMWTRTEKFGAPVVATAWMITFVLAQVSLAFIFERWSTDMDGLRPVAELQRQIPLWAGCGLVAGLFWQAIFQRNLSETLHPVARVAVTALAGTLLWAPFVIHGSDDVLTHLLPALAIGYLLVAAVNEIGAPIWSTMLWHAGWFAGLVWFRQALLL